MFNNTPELEKTDEDKIESIVITPLIFSAVSSSNISTSSQSVKEQGVKAFLKLVAEGGQDQAEELLKKAANLALASADVTDLSGRTFKNITGFQYAVWALDWHMWTMVRKYLSDDDAREQIQGMETGSWVEQHRDCASWQNLIDALQKTVDFYEKSKYAEGNQCWEKEVGSAQCLLPAHVIHEYCHPTRPFHPCPNFNVSDLPRSLKVQVYKDSKWVDEQWSQSYGNLKLGVDFAFVRSELDSVVGVPGVVARPPEGRLGEGCRARWRMDPLACHTLLVTRTQQRNELIAELTPKTQQYGAKK